MTTILISGLPGQLATAIKNQTNDDLACIFTNRSQFDITNFSQCLEYLEHLKNLSSPIQIDYIINCAAYTNVDGAETNKEAAHSANSVAAENLAKLAKRFHIKLIQISTDYVFPEYSHSNLPYTEEDYTAPINYYGLTKLEGEKNIINNFDDYIIIRTGWLYYENGKNFFNTIYNLARTKDKINVVADQIGTPTYCGDLADFIFTIIKKDLETQDHKKTLFQNIYNFSNLGQCSWFEFACEIVKKSGFDCEIVPISTEQYPTIAKRPKYSVLDKSKTLSTFGLQIPSWQAGLTKCLTKIFS